MPNRNTPTRPRLLGWALLLQAVASLISGAVLIGPLLVQGDIDATMAQVASHALQMRAGIVGDTITALGIVFLAAVFYVLLRKRGETVALVALGFYIMEATLLVFSRVSAHSLLRVSQAAVAAGHPEHLRAMATLALDSMEFAYSLHMLPFCLGATLFYVLLDRARIVPRWLSPWGVATVPIALVAAVSALLGYDVPVAL